MPTLDEDLARYAQERDRRFAAGDLLGGLRVLLKMGGEVAGWAGLFILSFKAVNIISIIFPPAIFGHGLTIHLLRQILQAVAYQYPKLPKEDREKICRTLGILNGFLDFDAGAIEVKETLSAMDVSEFGTVETFYSQTR